MHGNRGRLEAVSIVKQGVFRTLTLREETNVINLPTPHRWEFHWMAPDSLGNCLRTYENTQNMLLLN